MEVGLKIKDVEQTKKDAWYLLGREFDKLDAKDIQKFAIDTNCLLSKSRPSKEDFYKIANFIAQTARKRGVEVDLLPAKEAFVQGDMNYKYNDDEQMFLFNFEV